MAFFGPSIAGNVSFSFLTVVFFFFLSFYVTLNIGDASSTATLCESIDLFESRIFWRLTMFGRSWYYLKRSRSLDGLFEDFLGFLGSTGI